MPQTNKKLSRNEIVVIAGAIAAVGFALSFFIIAYTPLKNLIPDYPTVEVRARQVQTAMRLDSLEREVSLWELYSDNLRRVIAGEAPIQIDSIVKALDSRDEAAVPSSRANVDSTLRSNVAEQERFNISQEQKKGLSIEGQHMFKPLSGTVSSGFEPTIHPYIEIAAPGSSPVKSILDGTIIYSEWTQDHLWSIIIQHDGGVISVYRNCQKLLRKASDKVSAGTSIAILGGMNNEVSNLCFELWNNGQIEDPALYINF